MWTYSQSTGVLSFNGEKVGTGYSGHGEGLNNSLMQSVKGVGPVPQGRYTVDPFHDDSHLGACVAHLMPLSSNEMFGRSGFYIHGDNINMDHTASDGCIILTRAYRQQIKASQDNQLTVKE